MYLDRIGCYTPFSYVHNCCYNNYLCISILLKLYMDILNTHDTLITVMTLCDYNRAVECS